MDGGVGWGLGGSRFCLDKLGLIRVPTGYGVKGEVGWWGFCWVGGWEY